VASNFYCEVNGCDRETLEGRRMCPMHWKRWQRGDRGEELARPPAEVLSPRERFVQACEAVTDSDTMDDDAFEANVRAALSAAKACGKNGAADREKELQDAIDAYTEARRTRHSKSIRDGMATARASGKHVGRPPKQDTNLPDDGRLRDLVAAMGLTSAAHWLKIAPATLWRRMKRISKGHPFEMAP
jgi:hypothetical protein